MSMDVETSDSLSSYEYVNNNEGSESDVRDGETVGDVTQAMETNACSASPADQLGAHLDPHLVPGETGDKTNPTQPGPATIQHSAYPGQSDNTQQPAYPGRPADPSGGTIPQPPKPLQDPSGMPLQKLSYPSHSSDGSMPQHPPHSQPPNPATISAGPPVQLPSCPPSESSQPPGPPGSSSGTVSQPRRIPPPRPRQPPSSSSQARSDAPLSSDPMGPLAEQQQGKGEEEEEDREYSVLIIGKTGNGKSSLGNTITGVRNFKLGRGMFVATKETQAFSTTVRGRRLKVIDTADFTNIPTDASTAHSHIQQWKQHTGGGHPDVIVLAVRCDVRYTKEEHDIYREIVDVWEDYPLFCRRLMVAFTFGDLQDEDLREELDTVCEELKSVLRDAQDRYVQVNNRAHEEEEKGKQLEEICRVIGDVIKDGDESPTKEEDDDDEPEILMPEDSISSTTAQQDLAVLIIGKTGQGKSSVGNLITGTPNSFAVGQGLASVTTAAGSALTEQVSGRRLKVIDTPDLESLDLAGKRKQIDQWKKMTVLDPVVILLVVRCDVRITSDVLAVYRDVKKFWTAGREDPPCWDPQWIVVFTFRDLLDYDLKTHLAKCGEVNEILRETGGSFINVNNRGPEEEKRADAQKLLSLIHKKGEAAKRTVPSAVRSWGSPFRDTRERFFQLFKLQYYGGQSELDAVDGTATTTGHTIRYDQTDEAASQSGYCSIM